MSTPIYIKINPLIKGLEATLPSGNCNGNFAGKNAANIILFYPGKTANLYIKIQGDIHK